MISSDEYVAQKVREKLETLSSLMSTHKTTQHAPSLTIPESLNKHFQYGQFCSLHRVYHQSLYLDIHVSSVFISFLLLNTSFFSCFILYFGLTFFNFFDILAQTVQSTSHVGFKLFISPTPPSPPPHLFHSFRHYNTILFSVDRKRGHLAW